MVVVIRRSLVFFTLVGFLSGFTCAGNPKEDLTGRWSFDHDQMSKELDSTDLNNPFLSMSQGILSTIQLEVQEDRVIYRSLNKEVIYLLESANYSGNTVTLFNDNSEMLILEFKSKSKLMLKDGAQAKPLPMRKSS